MAHTHQAVDTAVKAAPPRFGLEASAVIVNTADRWEDGITWQPEQCAGGGRIALDECGSLDPVEAAATPASPDSDPFLVFAGETCSTFGMDARDWNGRARRQLIATRSAQIAAELWTGSLNGAGLALVDATSDILTTGAKPPATALAMIEQGLAQLLSGRQGMVHVTPQVLSYLVGESVARLEGNIYTSPNGHIIVPDAGYPGTAPTGTAPSFSSQWIYGTAVVALRIGPVTFNPGTLDRARVLAQAMNRATNTITVIAEQTVVIQLDPCGHVAAQVDLALPAVGGAS